MSFSLCKYKFLWNQHLAKMHVIIGPMPGQSPKPLLNVHFFTRPVFRYDLFWQSVPTLIINIFRHSNFFERAPGHGGVFASCCKLLKWRRVRFCVIASAPAWFMRPPAISQGWILHINLTLIFSINPPHCPPDWVRLQGLFWWPQQQVESVRNAGCQPFWQSAGLRQ